MNRLHIEFQRVQTWLRNRSILAQGFEPVSEAVSDKLRTCALFLAGVDEASLPRFPLLTERGGNP